MSQVYLVTDAEHHPTLEWTDPSSAGRRVCHGGDRIELDDRTANETWRLMVSA
jgi:hypothetical protein